jgi:polyferredoxin
MSLPIATDRPSRGIDLLARHPLLRRLSLQRWFPVAIALFLLVLGAVLVAGGFIGTPVGNRSGIVVAVWILWWFLLIAVLLPFGARAWCGVCPVPVVGDWVQRRRLTSVADEDPRIAKRAPGKLIGRNRYFGLALRWPRALSNLWLQNLGFLLLATFSVVLLTSPLASAVAVAGMVLAATAVAWIFRQRTFCRYLCPVGGFLGLYSMSSTLAVRARDASVCAACREKSCLAGSAGGWGCPWLEYPSRLDRNNACGFCLECVKSCAHGNMTLFLRRPFTERRLLGWDEAFKAYLMAALAITYSVVYLGPWGDLKAAANVGEASGWSTFGLYAGALWILALVVVPGAFVAAAWGGRRLAGARLSLRDAALASASALVPFGLLAWIAFSVPLILANGSYVPSALSDPFGWGWDLFGGAALPWSPLQPHWTPWLQAGLVLVGQGAGFRSGWLAHRDLVGDRRVAAIAFAPSALLLTAIAHVLLVLYAG